MISVKCRDHSVFFFSVTIGIWYNREPRRTLLIPIALLPSTPPTPLNPLPLVLVPIPTGIPPPPGDGVDHAQSHGSAPEAAPWGEELLPEALLPPQGHEGVEAGPGGRDAGGAGGVAREVEVGREEEGSREES